MASAFIIENTAGTLSISLVPGQLDGPGSSQRSTDAHLYGLGALSWGEGMDINILRLLESFACPDKGELGSPVSIMGIPQDENDLGSVRRGINNPIPGQQWFNTTNNKMYVYYREEVGSPPTVQEGWKLNSSVAVSAVEPPNPKPGDLWLDTTQTDNCNSHMLKVYRSIGGSPETYDFVAITENSVSKCGDTMSDYLTLHADPTNPLHASTKQYVDVQVAAAAGDASSDLAAHASNTNLHITSNQNTFLDNFESAGTITGSISSDLHAMTGYTSNAGSVYTNIDSRVLRSGDTMTGNLNMGNQRITNVGDPTFNKDAAHKQYVDEQIIQSSFPTGAVIPFVTSFAPPGWLSCDGQIASKLTYPALSTALGTSYGTGEASWITRTGPTTNEWTSVCYANDMFTNGGFVAVATTGVGNRAMYSEDGINWTVGSGAANNNWTSVCYGTPGGIGRLVAVAGSGTGNRVMTSDDGINWISRTSPADNNWRSVTYGNGLFVAVAISGTSRVMTSPDGITWTLQSASVNNDWTSVCYGNGLFVAVALTGSGNRVMTSPDGITWTTRSSAANNEWRSVCYGNGLFVAVAQTGTGDRVMTSPDGITWTARNTRTDSNKLLFYAADNGWHSVCFGHDMFVAVAQTGGAENRVMTSPDGINWLYKTDIPGYSWMGVTYGDVNTPAAARFVAVANSGGGDHILTADYDGTTFRVPDFRGEFLRGWDNGRDVDPGRDINTWQNHMFQDHVHSIRKTGADSATSSHSGNGSGSNVTGNAASGNPGAETRPRNFALHLCIKT